MVLIVIFRNATAIRSSSPVFTEIMCIGAILIYCAVILWVQIPTNMICSARIWLASLGYMLLIGSLLIKNIRIWLIFDNESYKKRQLPDWKLMLWLSVLIIADIILLIIWQSTAAPLAVNAVNIDSIGQYDYMTICTSQSKGNDVLYAILLLHAASLLFGCFLSFKLKDVSIEEFNECKSVAMILYSIALCLFIIIPLLIAHQTQVNQIVIIDAAMFFTTTASLAILFTPKLINIFTKGLRNKEHSKNLTNTTEMSTSTSNKERDPDQEEDLP